jgi:ABC-type sugar transport system ATPase subunit
MTVAAGAVPALRVSGLTKRYGGELALDGATFEMHAGEIHAVLGENGAGKSTLGKIVAGVTKPDEGIIEVNGEAMTFGAPAEAAAAGVAMVYQENSLIESMTVTKNLFLGQARRFNRISKLEVRARHVLESQNFHIDPTAVVGSLSAAQKQMVEIARAVNSESTIIVFDEPTASITPEEKQQLFLSMGDLCARGVAIMFVTHNLEEALEHADRITVMRDGTIQHTGNTSEMTRESIIRLMVGRDVEYARHGGSAKVAVRPTLEIDDLSASGVVQNMSFSLFAGQVTVLAGLVGSGRSETALIAFGAMKRRRLAGGAVRLNGERVRYRTPRQAIRDGIVYITEDRKTFGIFTDLSVRDNIAVGHLGSSRRLPPVMNPHRVREMTRNLVERFKVRTLNIETARVVELSGGNQQKVLLAKALTKTPKVVIFDEPTRGVDVGAVEDIHAAIREYAEQGVAVLVISSYLPEVLALADRVLVTRGGRVVEEFAAEETDEEQIMFAATH